MRLPIATVCAALAMALAPCSAAQSTPPGSSESRRFDVVSVKVDHSGTGGAGDRFPKNGAWHWTRIPLSFLVSYAYGVSLKQVEGIPEAFQGPGTAFNITAKMPPDVTHESFEAMLQSLLADRFHAVVHRETREIPVNTIEVAKNGAKLQPAAGKCVQQLAPQSDEHRCGAVEIHPRVDAQTIGYEYIGRSISVGDLAAALSANGPVVDTTGIQGLYDIDVKFEMEIPPGDTPAAEREFQYDYQLKSAFEKQLGLIVDLGKLKKRPVMVVVVDRVEMPLSN